MDKGVDWEIRSSLRKQKMAERDTLSEIDQYTRSSRICVNLFKLEQIQKAQTVFVYMDYRSEVQTMEFINLCILTEKTVTIPYTMPQEKKLVSVRITNPERDVEPGYCGILEPLDRLLQTAVTEPQNIDVAIIPGSVFDRKGGRLGYGGGYYDRFLSGPASRAFRIGIAYEVQIVEKVPLQEHDQTMDMVITEKNIYDCRRERYAQDGSLSR